MKLQSQANVPSKPDYRQPGTVIKTFAKVSDLALTPAMVSDSLNVFMRIFHTRPIKALKDFNFPTDSNTVYKL